MQRFPSRTARTAATIAVAAALLSGCALVTVPVEVAGDIASTTVKTAGTVVSAPFKMVGGGDDAPKAAAEPAAAAAKK